MAAHQRIVAGLPATLTLRPVGGDGEPVDPGAVTVTVTRADGTLITGLPAVVGAGTAARTVTLTGTQVGPIDRLAVAWAVAGTVLASTVVDVVSGVWFANDELRAAETGLTSTPVGVLQSAREQVEANIEQWCGQAFIPRFAVEVFPATIGSVLLAGAPTIRRIRFAQFVDAGGITVGTLTPAECAAIPASTDTSIWRSAGWSTGVRVRVGYEHGQDCPPPRLKAAAMRLCREIIAGAKSGGIPDNATNFTSSELGWSAVLVTPGVRGAHTSIPWVNEQIDANTYTPALLR